MFSLSKIALFSLISFATLALALPAPEPRSVNAKTALTDATKRLEICMLPVACATPSNNTANNIVPILTEATSILTELTYTLEGASLGCTVEELLELVADLVKTILDPLNTACGSNSELLGLVGGLVAAIVALVQMVLGLVGPRVTNLLALLIANGCVKIILGLGLSDLIDCLGLGGVLLRTLGRLL